MALFDFNELDDIEAAVTAPDLETRQEWARAHSLRIAAMLETPALNSIPGRVWRMRRWLNGDYEVVTLLHRINPPPPQPNQMDAKVITYVARGYHRTTMGGGSVITQTLGGDYSTDEIVAFLRLDVQDPDTVEWRDETHYSPIIQVGDILRNARRID